MLPTPITSQLAGLLPFESGHGAHLSEYRMWSRCIYFLEQPWGRRCRCALRPSLWRRS